MIPVVWVSYRQPEIISRGYWDEGLLERLFDRRLWRPVRGQAFQHLDGFRDAPMGGGAVVVVPAQHHFEMDHVRRLTADLWRFDWCLVILAGDECSLFPWQELKHPRMGLWVMTLRPETHDGLDAFIGEGWHVDTPDVLAQVPVDTERSLPWFFAGQVTHRRRRACVEALSKLPHLPEQLVETAGFTQGLDRHEYLRRMATAKIVPAPSGPGTPDSFRAYEALEAGCLPLVDATTSEGWPDYWTMVYGDVPFPVVEDWADLPEIMDEALAGWPANANRASAWWQGYKRDLSYRLESDLLALGASMAPVSGPEDRITVLMPTSPMPSNPSTEIIETTMASIRAQPDLARAEVIVMIDGVRAEQEGRRVNYEEYVRRLLLLCNRWPNVVPMLAEDHQHQANLTRRALQMVRTRNVVFVEHDTPIEGSVPWGAMADVIESGEANVIRLHHESEVLRVHRHLMLDEVPRMVCDVPLLRCAQWSQRPHLASTDFYRWMVSTFFGVQSRTMIEDVIHGVLDHAWREHGESGWQQWRVWMYAPPGNIRRTYHLDGRGHDPKYDMLYAYDGPQPEGAPRATADRMD